MSPITNVTFYYTQEEEKESAAVQAASMHDTELEQKHRMPVEHVLPEGVEDIDIHDVGYPEFVSDFVKEIYDYLFAREV